MIGSSQRNVASMVVRGAEVKIVQINAMMKHRNHGRISSVMKRYRVRGRHNFDVV